MRLAAFGVLFVLFSGPAHSFSESGHHVIAELAFARLDKDLQATLIAVLKEHPRYAEDLKSPANVLDRNGSLIGRASYWPEVASEHEKWSRPTWHYELAATDSVGDIESVPALPGPLPESANLDTQELHIAQAVELCRKIIADPEAAMSDKAIAICWICHLVVDAHQPCHAGSLYVEHVFPQGDRHATAIRVEPGGNLHALWDGLLEKRFQRADVWRLKQKISGVMFAAMYDVHDLPETLAPETWLAESRNFARKYVYTSEVMDPITVAMRGRSTEIQTINLSEEYLETAGSIARIRAYQASFRLAEILKELKLPPLNEIDIAYDSLDSTLQPVAWMIGEYDNSIQHSLKIEDLKIVPSSDGKRLEVSYTTKWDFEEKLHLSVNEEIGWNSQEQALESTYRVSVLAAIGSRALQASEKQVGTGSYLIFPDESREFVLNCKGKFKATQAIQFSVERTEYGFKFEKIEEGREPKLYRLQRK